MELLSINVYLTKDQAIALHHFLGEIECSAEPLKDVDQSPYVDGGEEPTEEDLARGGGTIVRAIERAMIGSVRIGAK